MTDTPPRDEEIREARVVSKHLDPGYSAEFDGVSDDPNGKTTSDQTATQSGQESSLKLLGGDVHRDLYKVPARTKLMQRAATFSHLTRPSASATDELNASDQQFPGGFRRQFLLRQNRRFHSVTAPVTDNFVSFLDLYGSFAGEDLAESDDDLDDESALQSEDDAEAGQHGRPSETRPLLGRRKSSRRAPKEGDAGDWKTFFTLLKAFVGTGIMFLPKAFKNGGILFSAITLVTVSLMSSLCFHLLLQCRKRYGGGYGELAEAIGGPRLRSLILASITISQIGFVTSGIIFTAENMYSFVDAVSPPNSHPLSSNALIALQLVVLIPLAFIRNISKLGPVALLADVCILIGLTVSNSIPFLA